VAAPAAPAAPAADVAGLHRDLEELKAKLKTAEERSNKFEARIKKLER
jgi:cell division protein FtsB